MENVKVAIAGGIDFPLCFPILMLIPLRGLWLISDLWLLLRTQLSFLITNPGLFLFTLWPPQSPPSHSFIPLHSKRYIILSSVSFTSCSDQFSLDIFCLSPSFSDPSCLFSCQRILVFFIPLSSLSVFHFLIRFHFADLLFLTFNSLPFFICVFIVYAC